MDLPSFIPHQLTDAICNDFIS